MTYAELVATRHRANHKYVNLRGPVLGDPEAWRELSAREPNRDTREHALWNLARLERYALTGVYGHQDARFGSGKIEADVAERAFFGQCHILPQQFQDYAILLWWKLKDRQEQNLEPTLSPLEKQRFDAEVRLFDLWGDLIAGRVTTISMASYPTRLPRDRAEPYLRWLGSEVETLRTRAEAKAAALKSA